MDRKELNELIDNDLFSGKYSEVSVIKRIRVKHFTPSTNFVFLCRLMWYYYQNGNRLAAKFLYLKIYRKYNCCVFPDAKIGKGLSVYHPIGIVIGHCRAGENLSILQGVTIGEKSIGEHEKDKECIPTIGNNVTLGANSCVLGNVSICDNVVVGANSVVVNNLENAGVYVGAPARRVSGA